MQVMTWRTIALVQWPGQSRPHRCVHTKAFGMRPYHIATNGMFAHPWLSLAGEPVVKPLSRRHLCEQLLLALAQLDAQECDDEPPGGATTASTPASGGHSIIIFTGGGRCPPPAGEKDLPSLWR